MRLFRSRSRVDVSGLPKDVAARLVQLVDDVAAAPHDLRARRALADCCRGIGRFEEAIAHYQALAGAYAAQGLLFRAIAVCKTILELDPGHTETERALAQLYARHDVQSDHALTVELPVAMGAALVLDDADVLESSVVEKAADDGDGDGDDEAPPLPVLVDDLEPLDDNAVEAAEIADSDDEEEIVDGDVLAALTVKAEGSVALSRPQAVPLFSGLSSSRFTELVQALRCWQADAGAVIVAEGEPGDSVFVIARGAVAIQRTADDGSVIELAQMSDGDFFGEIAIMAQRPRAASVVALRTTELLEIDRATLAALVERDPHVKDTLEGFCTRRLIENTMKTSPLFTGLDDTSLLRTIGRFESVVVDDGATLVHQGEGTPGLHILLQGTVDVVASTTVDGLTSTVRLKRLGPGDVFGEMGLLRRQPATASCVAVGPARLAVLGADTFFALQDEHPALRVRLQAIVDARAAFNARFLPDNDTSGARAGTV